MKDALEYITGADLDELEEFVDEKFRLLQRDSVSQDARRKLGRDVHDYMTAWQPGDDVLRLVEFTALAVAIDTSSAAEAIGVAVQQVIPLFGMTDVESLKGAQAVVRIASRYYRTVRFKVDFIDFRDLLESDVLDDPALLATVAAVLLDRDRRSGEVLSLKRVIDIVYSLPSFDQRSDIQQSIDVKFCAALVSALSPEYWALALPELKYAADETAHCTVCRFIRSIWQGAEPTLLMLNFREADWIIRVKDLDRRLQLAPLEFENHAKDVGAEMPPSDFRSGDLVDVEFFDRIGAARSVSLKFVQRFREDNVVPIRVGLNFKHGTRSTDGTHGGQE